jgi:putative restriction endonuclease
LHRDIRRGICGGADNKRGAESIVLSGGYEDDLDLGQIIYFTGIGSRDTAGRLIADQSFTGLNRSLAVNVDTGQVVRVCRAVDGEFEYSGVYAVEDAFLRNGANGFLICSYRLRAMDSTDGLVAEPQGMAETKRALASHYRLIRDASVPARVKALYDHRCQICGIRIEIATGAYSEGAHIVPLGGGAQGPDVEANLLCLCPNHHVMLDHGSLYFTDDWSVVDRNGMTIANLTRHADHQLDRTFAQRHRELMGFSL